MQPADPLALAERVVRRCRRLGEVSEESGRLTRPFATPAMARANALVGGWMEDAGLEVRVDAAANLVGRWAGTEAGAVTLLLGSHLDTVRDAGAFDGPLGVAVALAAVEHLQSGGRQLPFDVEILGFCDEEGLRFGTAYLGSLAVAGNVDDALLELADDDGVRMDDALRAFGGDPAVLATVARKPDDVLGYCEVHIEQGTVLEDRDVPVGVVTAIAGATRAEARFTGRSGHAGTVPMNARRDALCAAAEWALDVERRGRATPGLLATVGRLAVHPGATNVVPGAAVASLDVRHAEDALRVAAVEDLRALAERRARDRELELTWRTRLDNAAVAMDERLTALLSGAVAAQGSAVVRLPSGAGHDAVALAGLTGVAMLFVRCTDGVSHHPDERVESSDVAVAIATLASLLEALAG